MLGGGIEVVFFGSDAGEETVREIKMPQNFARSMSLADALNPNNLLCYEMNGAPLPQANGFPLRLIVPGWYGIANVKWLERIEVWNTRLQNRFMARDYVTIREEQRDGQSVWTESSVGRSLLKSAPVKVTRRNGRHRIIGAAWGAPIDRVEVQIDNGPWLPAMIEGSEDAEFAWKIWSLDWTDPAPGRAHHHLAGDRWGRTGAAGDGRSAPRQQAHLLGKQRPDNPEDPYPLIIREESTTGKSRLMGRQTHDRSGRRGHGVARDRS